MEEKGMMKKNMMVDMGMKESSLYGPIPSTEKQVDKISFPSLSVHKDIGLSEDDVGKEMMVMCKLKVIEVAKEMNEKGKRAHTRFEVKGMNMKPDKKSHYKTS